MANTYLKRIGKLSSPDTDCTKIWGNVGIAIIDIASIKQAGR